MHFLLVTVGSHGDIHPFLAIGKALLARGHRATVLTNPSYQRQIEAEGLGFWPFGDSVEIAEVMQHPGVFHPVLAPFVLFRKFVNPQTQRCVEDMIAAIKTLKPNAALVHPLCLAAPGICELHNVPWASCALAPISWNNPHDTPIYQNNTPTTPSSTRSRFSIWVGRRIMRWVADSTVNQARRGMGLPPSRDFLFENVTRGKINLGLWSTAFRPPMPRDPPSSLITGFPFFDRVTTHLYPDEERSLESFLNHGPPPVLFSLGTAGVHVAGAFYESAATAASRLGVRAILLTSKPEYAPKTLPLGVAAFRYAPFSQVLPRCCAFVHHGGIGTTAQGLRASVPALIAAMAFDQFDNAARVERLSAGKRFTHRKACNPAKLATALRAVLDSTSIKAGAQALAGQLRHEDGAAVAAAALEKL